MEFNLDPYNDGRLDTNEIFSFINDLGPLKFEIICKIDIINQQYSRMEASAKAQKLAISYAKGILDYNSIHVPYGSDKKETCICENINSSMECTTNVSKEIMVRCLHELISDIEKLKQKAEDLLCSPALEMTDCESELDEAIAKCDAWLADCKEREQ